MHVGLLALRNGLPAADGIGGGHPGGMDVWWSGGLGTIRLEEIPKID